MRLMLKKYSARLILCLLSGLLLALAFPKSDQGWLAWGALVPLLVALREVRPRAGFALAWSGGLAYNLAMMYWTVHSMYLYGKLPLFLAIMLLTLLAAYLAVFWGLYGLSLAWMCDRPWHMLVLSPLAWVATEFLRAWLFTGFPWELLGYSQYQNLWVIQFADLLGVYGVSALIVWVNSVLALALLHWLEKPWQGQPVSRSTVVRAGLMLAISITAVAIYGATRIHAVDRAAKKAKYAKVSVIQGNIDQAVKWDPSFQVLTTVKYKNMSLTDTVKGSDLIIWPETATPFYFLHDKLLTRIVMEGIKASRAFYLIGSPSFSGTPGHYNYFNSAYLINPAGEVVGKYDKVHLVPFGEYVPLKRWLPFIHKMVAQVGDFKAGRRGATLRWQQHRLGMLICYEVIFPGLARAMVQNGANLLVNITNDAWFGRTSAAYQHFSMAVFRAVENRRSLARAANTGISGFIDPCGRRIAMTRLFEQSEATAEVALLDLPSTYTGWGDWPLALLTFLFLLGAAGRRLMPKWPALSQRLRRTFPKWPGSN